MKTFFSKSIAFCLIILVASCVKQPVIVQGKTISSDLIVQIKEGMSQEQVRLILGSPALIDIFDSNSWTYYYSNAKINERNIDRQGSVELIFKGNSLAKITHTGNLVVQGDEANLQGGTIITKPTQRKRGIFSGLF